MTEHQQLKLPAGDARVLHITATMTPAIEAQLIAKSRQPLILERCPNDAGERFASHDSLTHWQSKGRCLYMLLGPGDDLAGVIWYGKKAFPAATPPPEPLDDTFSIRLYEGYVGKSLARPFMAQTLALYAAHKKAAGERFTGLWLETDADNDASLATYAKFGYQELSRSDRRVVMMLPLARVLQIINTITDKE
jgi:GNAT superfamily N-acetyltransferase